MRVHCRLVGNYILGGGSDASTERDTYWTYKFGHTHTCPRSIFSILFVRGQERCCLWHIPVYCNSWLLLLLGSHKYRPIQYDSPQTVVRKKCPVENVRLPLGVRLRQVEMIGAAIASDSWVTWCTNSLPVQVCCNFLLIRRALTLRH